MSLRKLFENASASEFLRDIYWALFDAILAKTETIPGIFANLIVTVKGKYTFFCTELISCRTV